LLVLTTSFPNRTNPASGVFVHRLLEHLPEGFELTILTPDTDRAEGFAQRGSLRIRPFRYAPRRWQKVAHRPGGLPVVLEGKGVLRLMLPLLFLAAAGATFFQARRVDLIHAHWAPNGVIAGLAGLLMRRPVITTLRGTDVDLANGSAFSRLMLRCCLLLNREIVAVSNDMARRLGAWFPGRSHNIRFIPNGVEISKGPSRKANASFTLAMIGNLVPDKRVDVVIHALSRLKQSSPDARLLVVGDGPRRQSLKALVQRSGLQNQVAFLGLKKPHAVEKILQSCDALVLASEKEGRPNVVLEAMAAGVPVVGADIPPVRELLGHSERGLLLATGDVEHLAAQLIWLRGNREAARRLARIARAWLHEQGLSWQQTATAYASLYRKVLAQNHARKATCAE
ncbi:MAG: glycosyltransferase, partial [Desulfosarcinaceae bacterium]